MGIRDWFRGSGPPEPIAAAMPEHHGMTVQALALDDPRVLEFLRYGEEAVTGQSISVERAMRNPAMFRAVSLITTAMGMLPTNVLDQETGEKAKQHPLYKLLHNEPNGWQSAFDFKCLMQFRALVKGNAYALIVRSRDLSTGKQKVLRLVPLDPDRVTPIMNADWTLTYKYQPNASETRMLRSEDVFHLRGMSFDGINGVSLVKQARDAIGIALAAELAAGRLLKNGMIGAKALKTDKKLSQDSRRNVRESVEIYRGADNAGGVPLFEEGLDWAKDGSSGKDAELNDLRSLQVEEIARVSGVPRPLLMVDETSWGSGIEALGQFFVGYTLNGWFSAWQETAERTLLSEEEKERYIVRFNPGALLRGSLKDQADYLSKALGAGGHQPWMYADEARGFMDLPKRADPPNQMMSGSTAADQD